MTETNNAKSERRYFELFMQDMHLQGFKPEYSDKFDVIIRSEAITIGIELTNFYIKSGKIIQSEQRQKKLREKVTSEAKNIYLINDEETFDLSFSFDSQHPILHPRILTEKLVHLAKRIENAGLKNGHLNKGLFSDIQEVSSIYHDAGPYKDPRWGIYQVYGNPPPLSRKKLIDTIKENKIKEYSECTMYWLLVVIDFMDEAQDQEIMIDDLEPIYSEKFDKIFVYKPYLRQILEAKSGKFL